MTQCTPQYNAKTREMMDQLEKLKATARKLAKPEIQNKTRLTQLGKQEAALKERIASGDTSHPARPPKPVYNEAVFQAQARVNRLKAQAEELIAKGDRLNRSPAKKILGTIHDIQMGALLASWHVFKKLGYAVGGGHVMSALADVTRSAARHIPGINGIAEQAPQYGRGLDAGALKARWQGVKEAPKEALSQLRYGQATREMLGGKKSSDEYFTFAGTLSDALKTEGVLNKVSETTRALAGYVGRTHAAVKEFLSQPEFREGIARQSKFMVSQLEKAGKTPEQIAEVMGRESTQTAISAKALERSYEAKMQGKNAVSSSMDNAIATLDRSDNAGANFLGFLIKTILPIRKIGVNVAIQGSSLMAGGVKALAAAFKSGDMTPERADYIMKNIGQQGAGAALLAVGILYYNKFGGVPGVFSKKDQNSMRDAQGKPISPGAADGFGSEAFHGAPFAMMQVGASMMGVFQKEYGREKGLDLALDVALKPTLNWYERTVPYTDQARRMADTMEYGRGRKGLTQGLGEIAGNTARGMVIPGVVQQYAAAKDPSKFYRQPRNPLEDIETGIPGLREKVPVGHSKRPDK